MVNQNNFEFELKKKGVDGKNDIHVKLSKEGGKHSFHISDNLYSGMEMNLKINPGNEIMKIETPKVLDFLQSNVESPFYSEIIENLTKEDGLLNVFNAELEDVFDERKYDLSNTDSSSLNNALQALLELYSDMTDLEKHVAFAIYQEKVSKTSDPDDKYIGFLKAVKK